MPLKPNNNITLGIQHTDHELRCAKLSQKKGIPTVEDLFTLKLSPEDDVNPLYIIDEPSSLRTDLNQSLVTTSLPTDAVMVRTLELSLTKDRDIDAVLEFQSEPHLPYPIDEAIVDRIKRSQDKETTVITLLATRKSAVEDHLQLYQKIQLDPEVIEATPAALASFARETTTSEEPVFIVHSSDKETTCVLIENGNLVSAQSCKTSGEPLRLEITRILYALNKQASVNQVKHLMLLGNHSFEKNLFKELDMIEVQPNFENPALSKDDLSHYAIPIGLALSTLTYHTQNQVNFRQKEYAYANPWKRYQKPLLIYYAASIILALSFYLYGNAYLSYKEDLLKVNYNDLLVFMNRSYESFENSYINKHPRERRGNGLIPIDDLSTTDLDNRLDFIDREIEAIPELYPLRPNIPYVSDFLAWLNSHSTVKDNLQIESIAYSLVKYPEPNKKNEKYQVKVEVEFVSPSPELARSFNEALNTPNDFVDQKNEIKWTSSRGKYRATFYLKDKTIYPSLS